LFSRETSVNTAGIPPLLLELIFLQYVLSRFAMVNNKPYPTSKSIPLCSLGSDKRESIVIHIIQINKHGKGLMIGG